MMTTIVITIMTNMTTKMVITTQIKCQKHYNLNYDLSLMTTETSSAQ